MKPNLGPKPSTNNRFRVSMGIIYHITIILYSGIIRGEPPPACKAGVIVDYYNRIKIFTSTK